MTNYVVLNDGTDYGNKTGRIASVVQGEVGKVLLIDVQDQAGNDFSITGATSFVGRMESAAGAVTTVTGTITVSNGGLSWDMSSGDVGTAGRFSLLVQFTLNGDIYKTHPVTLNIIADPAATEVQGDTNVTIPQSEATWLTAEKLATETAASGEILESDGDNGQGSGYQTATSLRKHNFTATTAPGVGDDTGDGYEPGSLWVDVTGDDAYLCLDATLGAAVWVDITTAAAATAWGTITGTLADQTDLQAALDAKAAASDLSTHEALTTSAHGGLIPQDALIISKTEAYQVAAGDAGKTIEASGTFSITLPDGLDAGFQVVIVNVGAGVITLAAATTLTSDGTQLETQYTGATAYHAGSNVWRAMGRLT